MTHFIFDCDDVLLDWQSRFRVWLTSNGYIVDAEGPINWNLGEWIGCSDSVAQKLVRRFNDSRVFAHLPAMAGAVDFVSSLLADGHTASVVTCCGSSAAVKQARQKNLDAVFGADAFEQVIILDIGEGKFESLQMLNRPGHVVFVEDNFTHARSGAILGMDAYCLRRSHNRSEESEHPDTKVVWIDDLGEISLQSDIRKVS